MRFAEPIQAMGVGQSKCAPRWAVLWIHADCPFEIGDGLARLVRPARALGKVAAAGACGRTGRMLSLLFK